MLVTEGSCDSVATVDITYQSARNPLPCRSGGPSVSLCDTQPEDPRGLDSQGFKRSAFRGSLWQCRVTPEVKNPCSESTGMETGEEASEPNGFCMKVVIAAELRPTGRLGLPSWPSRCPIQNVPYTKAPSLPALTRFWRKSHISNIGNILPTGTGPKLQPFAEMQTTWKVDIFQIRFARADASTTRRKFPSPSPTSEPVLRNARPAGFRRHGPVPPMQLNNNILRTLVPDLFPLACKK